MSAGGDDQGDGELVEKLHAVEHASTPITAANPAADHAVEVRIDRDQELSDRWWSLDAVTQSTAWALFAWDHAQLAEQYLDRAERATARALTRTDGQ